MTSTPNRAHRHDFIAFLFFFALFAVIIFHL